LSPEQQAQTLAGRLEACGVSQVIVYPQGQWTVRQARVYLDDLLNALPDGITLGCAVPLMDATFPEEEFATVADVIVPIVPLDTRAGDVRARLEALKADYGKQYPQATIMPTASTAGQHADGMRWRARPDQIDTFLNACADLEWQQVSFMTWEDLHAQPILWRTVQSWEYTPPKQAPAPQVTVQSTPNAPTAPAVTVTTGTSTALPSNLSAREKLLQYGVALGSDMGGTWDNEEEIETILAVVEIFGESLKPLFTGVDPAIDAVNAFRVLYAPQLVKRNPTGNVNTARTSVWYGMNRRGYVMYFGNHMFKKQREMLSTGQGLGFVSTEIIAHEFSHTINWRYPNVPTISSGQMDNYYHNQMRVGAYTLSSGERVNFQRTNDGFTFAARSSNHVYETITDAIANFCYAGLTDDNLGKGRLGQLTELLTKVVEYRIDHYGDLARIQGKIDKLSDSRPNDNIASELQPAMDALATAGLDARLAQYQG
ncbi:MAG: hypothetical protein AAFN11_14840, partial [Chloroflexota bacterium]